MVLPDQVEAEAYVTTPLADLSYLNETEREQASALFEKYCFIFAEDTFNLGCANEVTHHIDTGDNKPVFLQPIQHSNASKETVSNCDRSRSKLPLANLKELLSLQLQLPRKVL
ncbi:hypothetical protein DSO57_1028862 [Entomophthora muscae]|uniref:Uncharacterized protein n=1 Tax=Entomophthora muscae TaxID=34485 RepID=A0ACC2UM52_9FUNG|nr:hypothetical protein DSO57_1028862 [Entomophthora muscae]